MSALSIQTTCSALTEVKQHALAQQDALPQGFPAVIKGNAPWVGSDFVNDETFVYSLTEFEVSEICQSLDTFKGKYIKPPPWLSLYMMWHRRALIVLVSPPRHCDVGSLAMP